MDQIACPESLPSLHVWSSAQIQDSHHWCSHTSRTCPIIRAILYSLVTITDQCSQLVPMDMPLSLPNWFIPSSSALLNPELLWNSQWSMNKFSVFQTSSERSHHLLDLHEGFLLPSEAASFTSPLIGGYVIFHTTDNSASEGEGVMVFCPWCLFLLWKFQLLWRALLDCFF